MRLGRDSQFSLMFWLGVALVVSRVSLLPADVGGCLLHCDDHSVRGFTGSAQGHFASSCFLLPCGDGLFPPVSSVRDDFKVGAFCGHM